MATKKFVIIIVKIVNFAMLSFITCFCMTGCSMKPRIFIHPEADIAFYQKIGIMRFMNLSNDRLAGEKMTSTFMTEMLISGKFEVVERGEFDNVVSQVKSKISSTSGSEELTSDQLKEIGAKSGAQGVIEGIVRDYDMVQIGSTVFPHISLDLSLKDVTTGKIVWEASYSLKGGPKFPIISLGETYTLGELAQKACKNLVRALVKKAF